MIIDIFLLLVMIAGFYIGKSMAIFKLLLYTSLAFISMMCAIEVAPYINHFLSSYFSDELNHVYIFSLIIALLLCLIFIYIINKNINRILNIQNLKKVDRMLSGILMSFIFAVLYSGLVWFFDKSTFLSDQSKQKSFSFELLYTIPSHIKGARKGINKGFNQIKNKTKDSIEKIKESHDQN